MGQRPLLAKPIPERQFVREFAREFGTLARVLPRFAAFEPDVTLSDDLSLVHARNARRYAECEPGRLKFFFAHEVRLLPPAHRLGLICHELGHAIMGDRRHTESAADDASKKVLGVEIRYDDRWPGRGLQYGYRLR